jgi:pyruvate formate lyase activating enzyme
MVASVGSVLFAAEPKRSASEQLDSLAIGLKDKDGVTFPKGTVFDIRRYSIHDGPGIRTTVFLKGCPLRCMWCHNPEGQDPDPEMIYRPERCLLCRACLEACQEGAISWNGTGPLLDPAKCTFCGACLEECYAEARERLGREMSVEQVMAAVIRDRPFYDQSGGGATFSGGEPLLQPDFLLALLQACRGAGIHTVLDTCGFALWETLDGLRGLVDLFLFDLKLGDDAKHRRLTGASNAPILRNLRALSAGGHAILLRVPIVPGVNEDIEEVRSIASIAAALPTPPTVELLPYHAIGKHKYERLGRSYALPETLPPSEQRMKEIGEVFREFGLRLRTGG